MTKLSRSRRVGGPVVLLFVTTLIVAACSSGGSSTGSGTSAKSSQVLTIALQSATNTLDPSQASSADIAYLDLPYESLIVATPQGVLEPGLATSWTFGDNNTQLVFNLRPNVKFADGEALTAASVVNYIDYFKKGFTPYTQDFTGVTAAVTGPLQVTVTSAKSIPILPLLFSENYLAGDIIAPAGLKNPSALKAQTYGAGPYQLDESATVSNSSYVYTPNPNFFDKSAIHFSKVVIKVITSESAELSALRTGQVDFMFGASDTVASAKSANLNVLTLPDNLVTMNIWNHYKPSQAALSNPLVRQALNYGINRSLIAQAVFGAYGQPGDQPSVPGWDGYVSSLANYYTYNPAKAKQLLAEAGYAHGLVIPVMYATIDQSATVVQAMASELANIGVTLKLLPLPTLGQMFADSQTSADSTIVWIWGLAGPQYIQVTSVFLPTSSNPPFGVPTPSFVSAFDKALTEPTADQTAAMQGIETTMVQQAYSVPVVQFDSFAYFDSKVTNVQYGPYGIYPNSWTPAS
jgi:peptide/nickel transport system substrate-binding protein